MKIIFLDVDGVLNSDMGLVKALGLKPNEKIQVHHAAKILNELSGANYPFDEKCLENFKRLVDETDANIVVSSTWRLFESNRVKLLETLRKYDLDTKIIGYTPYYHRDFMPRGYEIEGWLRENEFTGEFIILDDVDNMEHLKPHLILTNALTGLTADDVDQGIKMLNSARKFKKET